MNQQDYEILSKGISRDMSSQAIAKRLRIVGELYDLAKILSTAKNMGSVESPVSKPEGDDSRKAESKRNFD